MAKITDAASAGPIGLIAGNGRLPIVFARAAQDRGRRVVAVAHEGETDRAIEAVVDELEWVKIGQLGRIIGFFKKNGVTDAVLAGGITKAKIFTGVRPDLRAIKVLARMRHLKDDEILRAVAGELESEGIAVRDSTLFLPEVMAPAGVLTRRRPTRSERKDIALGWEVAKGVGALDVGQSVVVRQGVVLAVEAIEGTDETIRRGGVYGRGGAVVVKVCKPNQDLRFDLPMTGPGTIATMRQAGARVLAVEAARTILMDREEMIREADQASITIVGMDGQGTGS